MDGKLWLFYISSIGSNTTICMQLVQNDDGVKKCCLLLYRREFTTGKSFYAFVAA
jgi:hypothetical protein